MKNQLAAINTNYGNAPIATTNASGVKPTEYNVLVRPKKTEEKSKGGIILPDESRDREQFAQMEGVLVATSPLAFTYAEETEWNGAAKPMPGDRVLFAKYAGAVVRGKDGVAYRLIKDKDVTAVLE